MTPAYFSDDSPVLSKAERLTRKQLDQRTVRIAQSRKLQSSRKPIARGGSSRSTQEAVPRKNSARQERRRKANAEYYKSAEWRAKRKLTFERDGYRCTEIIPYIVRGGPFYPDVGTRLRCPNFGMNINGKQTGKGLVCEEVSYGHRGIPDRIDTCKTRCRECDRRLTPLERANHAAGFRR